METVSWRIIFVLLLLLAVMAYFFFLLFLLSLFYNLIPIFHTGAVV